MLNMDTLTHKPQQCVHAALSLAQEKGHQEISTWHFLHALVSDPDTAVPPLIDAASVSTSSVKKHCIAQLQKKPNVSGSIQPYLSNGLQSLFQAAKTLSKKMGDTYVSCEHFLLAFLDLSDPVSDYLKAQGLTTKVLTETLDTIRGSAKADSQTPEARYQVLEKYTVDLVQKAQDGHLDPVIGRDEEIRRVVQILCRRTKNNPVLIGEPGVGKTAIVEGLAQRIVSGDVPELLKHKRILALDMGALIAGAKYRGEFEDRLKGVLKEIHDQDGSIVLFIDEIHTLVGAGASEGAVDAANMLKPALARGELSCIGATTLDEYRKYIEKDTALERRFQQVYAGEPSVTDTISILRGLKEKYEIHHGIKILDDAILAAAQLSHRYIADRFLPDKAIDLIDEAASKIRIEIDSMPEHIDELERKITQLKIEKQALKRDEDQHSQSRLDEIEATLSELNETNTGLKAKWTQEKDLIHSIRDLKAELESLKHDESRFEREGDYEKVSEIRYKTIPDLEKKLEDQNKTLSTLQATNSMLKEVVDDEDIAHIISKWTGIPVSKLVESEREKLLNTEERLHERVIGQDDAITRVSDAILRSRSGLSDPEKPIGSFLFLGPTGVGKTELSKTLAALLFDSEKHMVRIDMSEYMEKHSVARLIGAPPGYVGHDEGGQLTEAIRRRPYAVVLLDEIEKAHPDVHNILLQIFDDGRLTDSKGRSVDFKNTIIIMTSNVGSSHLTSELSAEEKEAAVMSTLKASFKPEFLNRIDDIVMFHALSDAHIHDIVSIQLQRLQDRLSERKITLELSPEALSFLGRVGYDPDYGARPLKRVITKELENPLAKHILAGQCPDGSSVEVTEKGGALHFLSKTE